MSAQQQTCICGSSAPARPVELDQPGTGVGTGAVWSWKAAQAGRTRGRLSDASPTQGRPRKPTPSTCSHGKRPAHVPHLVHVNKDAKAKYFLAQKM